MARRAQRTRGLRHDSDEDFAFSASRPPEEIEEKGAPKMVLRSSRKRQRRVWTADSVADDDEFKYAAESESDEELIPPPKRSRSSRRPNVNRRVPKATGYNTRHRRRVTQQETNTSSIDADDTEAAAASLLELAEAIGPHTAQQKPPMKSRGQMQHGVRDQRNGQQQVAVPPTHQQAMAMNSQAQMYHVAQQQQQQQQNTWKRCALHVRIAYYIFYAQKRSQLTSPLNMFSQQQVMTPLSLDPTLEARLLKERNDGTQSQQHMNAGMNANTFMGNAARRHPHEAANAMAKSPIQNARAHAVAQSPTTRSHQMGQMPMHGQMMHQRGAQNSTVPSMPPNGGTQMAMPPIGQKFPSITSPVTHTNSAQGAHSLPPINTVRSNFMPNMNNYSHMVHGQQPQAAHNRAGMTTRNQLPSFNAPGQKLQLPPLNQTPKPGATSGVQLPQIHANHNIPPMQQAQNAALKKEVPHNAAAKPSTEAYATGRELPSLKNLEQLKSLPEIKKPPTANSAVPSFDSIKSAPSVQHGGATLKQETTTTASATLPALKPPKPEMKPTLPATTPTQVAPTQVATPAIPAPTAATTTEKPGDAATQTATPVPPMAANGSNEAAQIKAPVEQVKVEIKQPPAVDAVKQAAPAVAEKKEAATDAPKIEPVKAESGN